MIGVRVRSVLFTVLALPLLPVLMMGAWVVIVLSIMLKSKTVDHLCERLGW